MTHKSPTTVLREARALIADENRWCTEVMATDMQGNSCAVYDGVKFCAIGALEKVSDDNEEATQFLCEAAMALFSRPEPYEVNDTLGHAATMRMYDEAIRAADADEAS